MSLNLLKRDFSYEKSLKKNEKKFQPYFFFSFFNKFQFSLCYDPSAGSPTETLLRLLLPLDDKAY